MRRQLSIENLDQRLLFADLAPLLIEGTDGNDVIEVAAVFGSRQEVIVRNNGATSGPFRPQGPILIRGFAGADSIRVDASIYLPTIIDGGVGIDSLVGGSGDDEFLVRDFQQDNVSGGLGIDSASTDSEDINSGIEILNPIAAESHRAQTVRVLVVNFDPIIPSEQNRRLYEIFPWWSNPRDLAEAYKADLERASGGAIQFEIVEWRDINEIPAFEDGFRYSTSQYVANRRANQGFREGRADFPRIVTEQKIVPLINSGVIDEVWFFGDHFFNLPGESWMSGPGAFFINGPVYSNIPTTRPFASMGFSYERGVAEMLHNMGHRTESTLNRVYGGWNLANPISNWDRFSANVAQSNGKAGVGTTHYPANAESDYDTDNERTVASWADDFLSYPLLTGQSRPINRASWNKGPLADYERSYQNWYFARLPRAEGINPDGRPNNWWQYLYNFSNHTSSGTAIPVTANSITGDLIVNNSRDHTIVVEYSGGAGIRTSSIDSEDILVIGPNGFRSSVTMVHVEYSGRIDSHIVATYLVKAPGGMWDAIDQGTYQVLLNSNQVTDGNGVSLEGRVIGSYQARTAAPFELRNEADTSLLLHFNSSLNGAANETPTSSSQVTDSIGRLGNGARFSNGARAQYLTVDNLSSNSGTIEFWIQPDWNSDGTTRVFFEAGNRFDRGMLLAMDGANNLRFIRWGDDPTTTAVETGVERGVAIGASDWRRGNWYHLAATWDDGFNEMAFFLNGKLRDRSSSVSISNWGRNEFVIGSSFGGFDPANSTIDEFRISSRGRSSQEIVSSVLAIESLSDLAIDGNGPFSAGQSARFKASISGTEMTTLEVTRQAQWSSSNENVATVNEDGIVVLRSPGTADIRATLGALNASRRVDVLPSPGPRFISGRFSESSVAFGSNNQVVEVLFSNARSANPTSLGIGDLVVRGPNGFVAFPNLIGTTVDSVAQSQLLSYEFVPPGGYWDRRDNGVYWVDMEANQILDSQGEFALPANSIASFTVEIPDIGSFLNSRFYNVKMPFDVDNDLTITPLDVLVIVNYVNSGQPTRPSNSISSPPFLDPDNDGLVSPLDVLSVVNHLNFQGSGSGEGEQFERASELAVHIAVLELESEWKVKKKRHSLGSLR